MQNTVNTFDQRYFAIYPASGRHFYSCKDCGEVVMDRYAHDVDHRRRADPVIVFAKMSEIVTVLWGTNGH